MFRQLRDERVISYLFHFLGVLLLFIKYKEPANTVDARPRQKRIGSLLNQRTNTSSDLNLSS